MVSIPLKQLKQVTFRGNITIHFNEVVFVVSLRVNMQKRIPPDKTQYFLQEVAGCKQKPANYMAFLKHKQFHLK